jgi:hypothetical protein
MSRNDTPKADNPKTEPASIDCLALAQRLGLARAVALFRGDVAAACAIAERNRSLLMRALPPELEPWRPPADAEPADTRP